MQFGFLEYLMYNSLEALESKLPAHHNYPFTIAL
jgi:hypothetical protein